MLARMYQRGFRFLIGGMRLPTYKGNSTNLQEWLMNIQKKQVIYGLSDSKLVLLAFEGAVGPLPKFIVIERTRE